MPEHVPFDRPKKKKEKIRGGKLGPPPGPEVVAALFRRPVEVDGELVLLERPELVADDCERSVVCNIPGEGQLFEWAGPRDAYVALAAYDEIESISRFELARWLADHGVPEAVSASTLGRNLGKLTE